MTTTPPRSMAAALISISLSSAFVGANLATSYSAVRSLLLSAPSKAASNPATPSAHLARRWRSIFSHAMPIAITGSAISSASFVYAAPQVSGSQSTKRNLLLVAASTALLVVSYKLTLMASTNSVLMERAKAGDMMEDFSQGDVTEMKWPKTQGLSGCHMEELLSRWAMLNYGRAAIPAIGILCAIVALLP